MILNKLFTASLLLALFIVINSSASNQAAIVKEEGNEKYDRSGWVWTNEFTSTNGVISAEYLANEDTVVLDAGKSSICADDFTVGPDTIWRLDTLAPSMYWHGSGKGPDRIKVMIWPDAGGQPASDSEAKASISFRIDMPNPATSYRISLPVRSNNISLPEGTYWISFIGGYDSLGYANVPSDQRSYTRWNRANISLGTYDAKFRDSIGVGAPSYPLPWSRLIYASDTIYSNSTKFSIFANVIPTTPIKTSGFQNPQTLVSVYPNPASKQVLFDLNIASVKQVEIFDLKGTLVKTVFAKTKKLKVDIQSFTAGVYFYNLVDRAGKNVERGKFSVSK